MLARSGLPKRPLHALDRLPLQSQYDARASDELRSWTIFFIVPHLPLQNGSWSSPNTGRNDFTRSCLAVSSRCSLPASNQHPDPARQSCSFRRRDGSLRVEFNDEVPKANLHWTAGVQLERNDSGAFAFRSIDIHAEMAIDVGANFAAHGNDLVAVPIVALDIAFARFVPQRAASLFFVQFSPP